MGVLLILLCSLLGLLGLILLVALFQRKHHRVQCEITINVPSQVAFDFLRFLSNQDKFNKWAKTDPNRKIETSGEDGTVGYVYAWSGNKSAGEGAKEITKLVEGKRIETVIRFIKPMKVMAYVDMETSAISSSQTLVTIINHGPMPYPFNFMLPFFEKNFAKDLQESLRTLKTILEQKATTGS